VGGTATRQVRGPCADVSLRVLLLSLLQGSMTVKLMCAGG